MQQQHHTNLNTGINSFVTATPDYELSPVGIASFQEQAQKLAEYGRNGDIYVVHAAEGETVIPMQVLDANPQIKELLFNQMRDMGMNPKEYVVGDELNSINPDTGMPEFFFKSIFKSVKKVFKKIAPIIVPMLGNLILPGIGGILASAMYTKLNGGSWGDVMKGAALSWAGGALMQGVGGALSDTGTFMEGFTSGLQAPFQAASDLSGSFDQGVFGTAGAGNMPGASLYDQTLGRTYDPNALDYSSTGSVPTGMDAGFEVPDATTVSGDLGGSYRDAIAADIGTDIGTDIGAKIKPVDFQAPPQRAGDFLVQNARDAEALRLASGNANLTASTNLRNQYASVGGAGTEYNAMSGTGAAPPVTGAGTEYNSMPGAGAETGAGIDYNAVPGQESLMERVFGKDISEGLETTSDYLFRGGESKQAIELEKLRLGNIYKATTPLKLQSPAEFAKAIAKAEPGMLAKYGPTAAIATGVAALGGAFKTPGLTDEERADRERMYGPNVPYGLDPDKYQIADLDPTKYRPAPNARARRVATVSARDGGLAQTNQYPRRELLVEGPGTERSDDIPAMLSDGEFVLNAKSVRGADPTGGGDRYKGAQHLYEMMRGFEMRG
tara:strand:- start:369 stop:2198 length:1830 start_codon:yes stop_codon:yes gene_type:complete